MLWFVFSFITAFCESFKDIISKKSLKNLNEYVLAASYWVFQFPIMLGLLIVAGLPLLGPHFWWALGVEALLSLLSTLTFMRALKSSELSLSIPLITTTPVFMLLISWLLLGEFPSLPGLAGIILIVVGAYSLNFKHVSSGIFKPFKALISQPGPRLMLISSFIWSITATIDKVGVLASSAAFWNLSKCVVISIAFIPLVLPRYRQDSNKIKQKLGWLVLVGLFVGIGLSTQMLALKLTLASYVIAIKRVSAVLGVLLGWLIFKESDIKPRLVGALIMLAGVALIAIS
jgi:uncharacterized membrane protein